MPPPLLLLVRWINRVFLIYRKVQALALPPTSCVTLAKLLKHLGLHFSDLPNVYNNLCSPRSLGDPGDTLRQKAVDVIVLCVWVRWI